MHNLFLDRPLLMQKQVYVLEGDGIMRIGSEEYKISIGDMIYIPKNTVHSVQVTSETAMKVIS